MSYSHYDHDQRVLQTVLLVSAFAVLVCVVIAGGTLISYALEPDCIEWVSDPEVTVCVGSSAHLVCQPMQTCVRWVEEGQ
jgi:hypothetical protein